ncbi:ABC transporter ATP-binding protein [Tessaracoccus caeni]|uniref:ABC transporter ATP-binding protein n=1 Tax=Tessaracoccus caeni TaxID=3031239 RepID=UPI0023DA2785|nr:ABC transporter ATP-binding protein [Tessaracoccus caeni]MDF1489681.1 ABC transporter ATP-binding protein [Tessaracoccus caeni]
MIRTLFAMLPDGARPSLVLHFALTVVSVVVRAISAVLLIPLLAALFGTRPEDAWPWVGALALSTAAGWALDWAGARVGYRLGFGLLDTGQHTLADRLARTRLTWFTGDNRATARQSIAATGPDLPGIMVYLVTPVISALLLPIMIGIALLPIAPMLGLVALAGVPLLGGAYLAGGFFGRAADKAASEANSAFTERIVEFARTQHALRAARRVDPERSQVGAALRAQHGAMMRLIGMQIPGQLVFSVVSQAMLLALTGTTVWLVSDGRLGVPQAIALIVVIVRYLEAFTVLAELSGGVESASGVLRRIRTVLESPVVPAGSVTRRTAEPVTAELRGVSFAYDDVAPPVLDRLDLAFAPGTTTAIVGPSGSGKTTVLALLAGLHHPTEGSIVIDGDDALQLDADSRRSLVSMVFQQPYLFDGSIRDNVLAGDPEAGERALSGVAELARVAPVLRALPNGWKAGVGEAGARLSGGERQRVSIARALLKPAPLLLVDEATSALDTENEAAVAAALTADPAPRTRVIVAHRLSSIRAADRVVFMERGRVVEDGTIDELLAQGGRFAEFWHHQEAASGWRLHS